MQNAIFLDAANAPLIVTNLLGATFTTFGSLPFGTSDGTATGAIGLKVIVAGAAAGSVVGSAAFAVQHVTANAGGSTTVATRAGRRGITIRNLAASPEPIYFGPTSGVTAVNGSKLAIGESIALDTVQAVFFFSAGGAGLVETLETF